MRLRDRLGIGERRQRQLVRLMELVLLGMFGLGLLTRDTGIIVNAGIALAVTQLPPLLERDYGVVLDAGLTLWLTAAVFLHAVGTFDLPGGANLYQSVWWYDHLTHALSASVVAAAGYTTARALDVHYDAVSLPPRFLFAFILMFTMAGGVVWEVLEFLLGRASVVFTDTPVLTQYGLDDTMLDLVFDAIGAVLVATFGTAYLSGVVDAVTERLARGTDP
jgi:hypothetical protein